MSIVLTGLSIDTGEEIVTRLIAEGDGVRVVESDQMLAQRWRDLGAHVAMGDAADTDFIERAAHGARTIAIFDSAGDIDARVRSAIQAAPLSGTGRVIVCSRRPDPAIVSALESSGLEFVVMIARRRARRRTPLAEAISAADDLAGPVRLVVELGSRESMRELGLDPEAR